jgi:hypothetical protein
MRSEPFSSNRSHRRSEPTHRDQQTTAEKSLPRFLWIIPFVSIDEYGPMVPRDDENLLFQLSFGPKDSAEAAGTQLTSLASKEKHSVLTLGLTSPYPQGIKGSLSSRC